MRYCQAETSLPPPLLVSLCQILLETDHEDSIRCLLPAAMPQKHTLTTTVQIKTTATTAMNSFFSRTTWVSQYQKGKTSMDLNEARDDRVFGCSGIRWTICK